MVRRVLLVPVAVAALGGNPFAASGAEPGPRALSPPVHGAQESAAQLEQRGLEPETAALFERAREQFFSAEQAATVALWDQVVQSLRGRRATGDREFDDLLVRALGFRAEVAFNLGDDDAAAADLEEMIRVAPGTDLDRDRASPKLAETFDALRGELVGSLVMNVEPADAVVYLNGEPVDRAAGVLSLLAGSYALGIERPGYTFVREEIEVAAGALVPVDAVLERASAALTLSLDPPDASLVIDDRAVTGTPGEPGAVPGLSAATPGLVTVDGLLPGTHVLEIAREGYRTRRETVAIDGLADYRLDTITLEATAGTIRLAGLPPDAEVRLNGRVATPRMGADGGGSLEVPPGDYEVEVDGGSRGAFTARASLADREEAHLDVRLRPTLAYLGVLGGDDLGRRTFEDAAAEAFPESSPWGWRSYAGEAGQLLATAGIDAGAGRAAAAGDGSLPLAGLQAQLAERLPASAYVLGVTDDDLFATRVDVWIWTPPPGPPHADLVSLELEGGGLADRLAETFALRGDAARPSLGALLVDSDAASGPTVFEVTSGGPADTAGVRVGDQVLELGGTAVGSAAEALRLIAASAPGSTIDVRLQRGPVRTDLQVALGTSLRVLAPDAEDVVFSLAWLEAESLASSDTEGWVLELNQVAALLHARDWESAVRRLRTIDAPERAGVGAGTAHYWMGLALSQLGTEYLDRAREAFARAAAIPGARLLHDDGPLIEPLAAARLAYLER